MLRVSISASRYLSSCKFELERRAAILLLHCQYEGFYDRKVEFRIASCFITLHKILILLQV